MSEETIAASVPSEDVAAACHEPFAEGWAGLDARLEAEILGPLRAGVARHREAVASAGLAGDPPSDWQLRSDRLLEYRRVVGAALLEPLAEAFEDPGPAGVIAKAFAEALERADENVRGLPVEVPSRWPEGALAALPSDGLRRRLGKFVARGVSAARHHGRERLLPLRSTALQHLAQAVAPAQDQAIVQAMASWAEWAGRLERAWLEWADAALPALVHAELPEDDEVEALWAGVRDAAASLEGQLEALLEERPHSAAAAAAAARLEESRGVLEADLAIAGSFLLSDESVVAASLRTVTHRGPALASWERDVASRLRLYISILAILAGATAVQRRLVQRFREGPLSRVGDLLEASSRLEALVSTLVGQESRVGLRERITGLEPRVTAALQPAFGAIPEASAVSSSVTEVADSAVEALLAMIRQAPTSLSLHAPDDEPPSGAREVEARPLPLQELARQSFDALRIERIRSSTSGLLTGVDGVRKDVAGLPEVFAFARDEALRELDGQEEKCEERAVELLGGALRRMSASLETRVEDLDKAMQKAQGRLASEINDGSSALLGRVGAGRMQAKLLAARSRLADLIGWVTDAWGPPVRRLLGAVRSFVGRVRGWVLNVVRKGSALLGREPTAKAASARTIQTLSDVQALVQSLPLVYQRLFTLDPISDPALLAGRATQLELAMERWQRWHSDEGVPLLVRGRQRSGITSFFHVLGSQIRAGGHTCLAVRLDERIEDDAALAALLAGRLALPACSSLDDVARAIFAAAESSLPAAVTIDNLEHVYMRVPHGTDLMERLLTLMAETEPRIFWAGGITSSAWQLVGTAEPAAVSQVDVMDLPPLDAEGVRAAILARHRRSGLDVRYEESTTARARLRRRLHRLRDGKGFRQLLEDEFFDQLYRASGGYLGLALFQWLQAASFESDEDVVMRLPERPDFSVLDQLSLTQNFTLKAFLEHRTLRLEEHDRIFRLPRHESYQIFESLRNRQLIEEVPRERRPDADASDIEGDLRYRVRPLLTGAVITHLQGRNIVH